MSIETCRMRLSRSPKLARSRNTDVSNLQINSVAKIPHARQMVDQWNILAHNNPNNLDQFAINPNPSGVNTQDIGHLTKKITSLQLILNDLCRKHAQICLSLCKQIQRKNELNSLLYKQNLQLNKELKKIVEYVHGILQPDDKRIKPKSTHLKLRIMGKENGQLDRLKNQNIRSAQKKNILKSKTHIDISKSPTKTQNLGKIKQSYYNFYPQKQNYLKPHNKNRVQSPNKISNLLKSQANMK